MLVSYPMGADGHRANPPSIPEHIASAPAFQWEVEELIKEGEHPNDAVEIAYGKLETPSSLHDHHSHVYTDCGKRSYQREAWGGDKSGYITPARAVALYRPVRNIQALQSTYELFRGGFECPTSVPAHTPFLTSDEVAAFEGEHKSPAVRNEPSAYLEDGPSSHDSFDHVMDLHRDEEYYDILNRSNILQNGPCWAYSGVLLSPRLPDDFEETMGERSMEWE